MQGMAIAEVVVQELERWCRQADAMVAGAVHQGHDTRPERSRGAGAADLVPDVSVAEEGEATGVAAVLCISAIGIAVKGDIRHLAALAATRLPTLGSKFAGRDRIRRWQPGDQANGLFAQSRARPQPRRRGIDFSCPERPKP